MIDKIKNGEEFFINNEDELVNFKISLSKNNENSIMGYDDTYSEDKEVVSGFVKYDEPNNMFYLSKNKN